LSNTEVPPDIQQIGVPASTDEFTEDQRKAVFVGRDKLDQEEAGSPASVELLAINESGDSDGSWA